MKHRLVMLMALASCAEEPVEVELAETQSAVLLATSYLQGQKIEVHEVGSMSFLTSKIAACGQGVLYATRTDLSLHFTKNGGLTWTDLVANSMGRSIACDRRHLFSFDGADTIWHATTTAHGELAVSGGSTWSSTELDPPDGTTDIQSGMGNIYALKYNATTKTGVLFASELPNTTSPPGYRQGGTWTLLANNLGTNLATGAGAKVNYTPISTSLPYRKTNRAFGANPDDTLYYNDTLLDGQNWWTLFSNPGLDIISMTAEDSNTLYALVATGPYKLGRKLVRFDFSEYNCTDGLDNDANGQIDAEDPVCRQKLATSWCATHEGSYCIDRIQNTNGYAHARVSCTGGQATIDAGICLKVGATGGSDTLARPPRIAEPAGSAHYCNVHNPDGTWDFDYTGDKPCDELLLKHPNADVVRAGIYSTTGKNTVYVRCTNGQYLADEAIGTAPLAQANAAVGHTANRCVFTVSPKEMRVFNAPFPTSVWATLANGGRGYVVGHQFDHAPRCEPNDPGCPCTSLDCPVTLAQFGGAGSTDWLSNTGTPITSYQQNQDSYDYIMIEGVPLRSLGWGTVVKSRERDISWMSSGSDCSNGAICGTPYQGEIYVEYTVGSDPDYAEKFLAYYAHVRSRDVVEGQTVKPGQLLGYVGTTGSSSDPHLHFGLVRLTNTNGASPSQGDAYGWHVPYVINNSAPGVGVNMLHGMVDPYGWRAPGGFDPRGYWWSRALFYGNTGIGAWSPTLWANATETPPYTP